jgi:hypothetical protein
MQGMLAELDAPIVAERLDPFVEPSLCIAHLATKDSSGPDGRAKRRPAR